MILYGKGDPVEALQKLAPWVKQVHIKDAIASQTKGEWGTEVPVGEGQVDWSAFLKFVPEEINLAIEREIGENRVQDVKQAKQFLQGLEIC
jgi:sugar phosphate isomerase/epimerase